MFFVLWVSLGCHMARIISHPGKEKPRKCAAFRWLPHKDSNLDKQIQKVLMDGVEWLKALFFAAFVSVCFREKGCVSVRVGVTWVSVF